MEAPGRQLTPNWEPSACAQSVFLGAFGFGAGERGLGRVESGSLLSMQETRAPSFLDSIRIRVIPPISPREEGYVHEVGF